MEILLLLCCLRVGLLYPRDIFDKVLSGTLSNTIGKLTFGRHSEFWFLRLLLQHLHEIFLLVIKVVENLFLVEGCLGGVQILDELSILYGLSRCGQLFDSFQYLWGNGSAVHVFRILCETEWVDSVVFIWLKIFVNFIIDDRIKVAQIPIRSTFFLI